MPTELEVAKAFVAEDAVLQAVRIVDSNPWLCDQMKMRLGDWAQPLLARHGLAPDALHIIGSAATGFSLKKEQPGRPFRRIGGGERPSDLDVAIVDVPLFDLCWGDLVLFERQSLFRTDCLDREAVYWGHVDDKRLPDRAPTKRRLQDIANEIQRSASFRGYPCRIRVYRTRRDLLGYVKHSISVLERSVTR